MTGTWVCQERHGPIQGVQGGISLRCALDVLEAIGVGQGPVGQHAVIGGLHEGQVCEPPQVLTGEPLAGVVHGGLGVRVEQPGVQLSHAGGVMVALHHDGVTFTHLGDDLGRGRAVAHDVSYLEDLVDDLVLERLEDRLEGGEVRVNVT